MPSPPTPPPLPPRPTAKPGSPLGFLIALTFLAAGGLVFFALAPLMTVVVFALFGVVGLQYVIWGRWLTNVLREENPDSVADTED